MSQPLYGPPPASHGGVRWRGLGLTVFAGRAFAGEDAFRGACSRERLILVHPPRSRLGGPRNRRCSSRHPARRRPDPIRAAFSGSEVPGVAFGSLAWTAAFREALGAFFAGGGEAALVFFEPRLDRSAWVGEDAGPGQRSGLYFLADVEEVSTVVVPGVSTPEQRDGIARFAACRPHLQFLMQAESDPRGRRDPRPGDSRKPRREGEAPRGSRDSSPTTRDAGAAGAGAAGAGAARDVFDKRWHDPGGHAHPFPSRLVPYLGTAGGAPGAVAGPSAGRGAADPSQATGASSEAPEVIEVLRANVAVVRPPPGHGRAAPAAPADACGAVAGYLAATDFTPAGSPRNLPRRRPGRAPTPFGAPAGTFWPLQAWRRWEGLRRSIDLCTRALVLQADHPLVYRRAERQVRGFLRELAERGLLDRFAPLEAVCGPARQEDAEGALPRVRLSVTARLRAPRVRFGAPVQTISQSVQRVPAAPGEATGDRKAAVSTDLPASPESASAPERGGGAPLRAGTSRWIPGPDPGQLASTVAAGGSGRWGGESDDGGGGSEARRKERS